MKKNSLKKIIVLLSFLFTLIFVFILSIFLGSQKINFYDLFIQKDEFLKNIVLNLRLPRSILVCMCGALLAGSGCVFQGFFRNPLADSGVIGISSGATLGAILSTYFPITFFTIKSLNFSLLPLFAFVGALISVFLIYLVCLKMNQGSSTINLLLVGSSLSAFFSALTSVLILIRDRELHKMYVWTLGSFNGKTYEDVFFIIVPSVLSFILLFLCCKKLDIISYGEKTAASLGLNIKSFRLLVLIAGSLASSTAVCCGGTIGFIGLVSPHIIRKIFSPNHKILMTYSIFLGSILLLLSDIISRTIAPPLEIPIGIITSILGSPFFIFIIFTNNKKGVM